MKKRRKPLILLGFPAEFLASSAGFEPTAFRLGGGRSIRLSYWGVYEIELWTYRLWLKGGRFVVTLGGVCSIQLSY